LKECSICNETKSLEDFYSYEKTSKKKGNYTYYLPYCKSCAKKKTATERDPEKTRIMNRYYYKTRPQTRAANKKSSEKRRAEGKLKEWQEQNPDKMRHYAKQRIEHKKHEISNKEWISCKEYFDNSCAYCGFEDSEHKKEFNQQLHKEHVDHTGANDISNCVPACKSCNSQKWEFLLSDWYNENNPNFTVDKLDKITKWLEEDYQLYLDGE
jgi:HNH endonuclease